MEHSSTAGPEPETDPRLAALLSAAPAEADGLLAELVGDVVQPAIGRVLGSRLRRNAALQEERADLEQECLLRALAHLRLVRAGGAPAPARVAGYAAALAHNVLTERQRARQPRRAALKARLRYHLRHSPNLRLEPGADGPRAALAAWERRPALERWSVKLGAAGRRAALDASPAAALGVGPADVAQWPLPRLCVALLERAGEAVDLDQLVSWLAELLGVSDRPDASLEEGFAEPAAAPCEPGAALDQRRFLTSLWREVLELPERQRVALLLNLRDEQGQDALHLLAACGVASLDELAAALGWAAERLAAVWNELPLDDARLAGELVLARQQVINLRKSARERLARRLRAQRGPTSL